MGTLKDAEAQELRLLDDMSGHPGMAKYKEQGFEIITFKSFFCHVSSPFIQKPLYIFEMETNILKSYVSFRSDY